MKREVFAALFNVPLADDQVSVFVSVNAIRPQRKAGTRDAIGEIQQVFLDVDRDGPAVRAVIAARRILPPPVVRPSLLRSVAPNAVRSM